MRDGDILLAKWRGMTVITSTRPDTPDKLALELRVKEVRN